MATIAFCLLWLIEPPELCVSPGNARLLNEMAIERYLKQITEGRHTLSRDEAGWLLDAFKLGGDRRLPMGEGDTGKPKDRNRPNW